MMISKRFSYACRIFAVGELTKAFETLILRLGQDPNSISFTIEEYLPDGTDRRGDYPLRGLDAVCDLSKQSVTMSCQPKDGAVYVMLRSILEGVFYIAIHAPTGKLIADTNDSLQESLRLEPPPKKRKVMIPILLKSRSSCLYS